MRSYTENQFSLTGEAKSNFLSILFLFHAAGAVAQGWVQTSAPITFWSAVACSADGQQIVAASLGPPTGPIYVSTNAGISWTATTAPVANWGSIASSADGTTLTALSDTSVYISTNSGVTWVNGNVSASIGGAWRQVDCSSDGHTVAAANVLDNAYTNCTQLFVSTNGGLTWGSNTFGGQFIGSLRVAANGMKIFGMSANAVVSSTNFGTIWVWLNAPFSYGTLASSADGTTLFANSSILFRSIDGANTWVDLTNLDVRALACSADATKLVVAGQRIFNSPDSGETWTEAIVEGPYWTNWSAVASSADGNRLVAVLGGGGIYTVQNAPTPVLNIAASGSGLLLSWMVPSANFVLQQTADLTTGTWSDVTATRSLNYSNLQYQVSLPAPAGGRFYRLVAR